MKDLSDCSVMLVDDTETNIDVLLDALGDDYDISVCMDGESALEIAQEEHPDLILLDIMMPGMDGYEVCERLKSDPETAGIKIIFLSAMSEASDREKGLALGAVDFITKPFDISLVKDKVRQYLMTL